MKENHENKPDISVIMCVYNTEKYLAEAIESVLGQTYKNFEFIIIDDGSTDGSYDIANSYKCKDNRIRLYKQRNSGVAISLNKGISISQADIIARQDADDISIVDRFQKQMNFLTEHPEIYLLGTEAVLINNYGERIKNLEFYSSNEELQKELIDNNPFIHGSVMIRKSCFEKVGMYREQFVLCQSYDLWLRISEQFEIGILKEKLYQYRVWDEAISFKGVALNNTYKKIIKQYASQRREVGYDELMKNNYLFYQNYGNSIVDAFYKEDEYRWLYEDSNV